MDERVHRWIGGVMIKRGHDDVFCTKKTIGNGRTKVLYRLDIGLNEFEL